MPPTIDPSLPTRDQIFVSYRRDDARGASGRLYDWLRIGFGREHVFRDVHSLGVGKWRTKIDAALARSAACVAVIGPRWANADHLRRLHDEADMVRHELVSALADEELALVPTLVEGAELPSVAELPAPLRPLFETWNARVVSEGGWEDDTRRLIAEIAEATSLPVGPDLEQLLRDVGAAQQRVRELEETRHLQSDQIDALGRTIDDLRRKLAEASAGERRGLAEAFAELAQGRSLAAKDAFERAYDAQQHAAAVAQQTMAEAARNVANLALLRDVAKAVRFYRKALAAEADDPETARLLGHALIVVGDLDSAEQALTRSLYAATVRADSWGQMAAQGGLGDVFLKTRDLAAANDAFTATRRLAEDRLASDPANTQWQRDLSVSHERIGDVLAAQGDGPATLAAYRQGLAIAEALTRRDPANAEWQRDLSVSHIKIGDVLVAQGDGPAALTAYRQGLAI
ncbi:TIR domain-containing protein, partial [Accumulibacter sp.]|uniref:TIR domain-containing protein n=1 Tax=Accumulibacter sp. TaxID=2053492 RepID=UPI00263355FC